MKPLREACELLYSIPYFHSGMCFRRPFPLSIADQFVDAVSADTPNEAYPACHGKKMSLLKATYSSNHEGGVRCEQRDSEKDVC